MPKFEFLVRYLANKKTAIVKSIAVFLYQLIAVAVSLPEY
tara:strand:- start:527 stop:646 length:120 start_codon:yes stop_codon:yes gene_type:complete